MSEILRRKNLKIEKLKKMIKDLHEGKDSEKIKNEFVKEFRFVSGSEIAEMEQQLVNDGMDINEIMNLCDIHASIFEGNLEDIHDTKKDHPFNYFKDDNKIIKSLIDDCQKVDEIFLTKLFEKINHHYSQKEQLLFPLLEYIDIKTVPQVMWGVDDEIRHSLKELIKMIKENKDISIKYGNLKEKIGDMITKENKILFNMLEEHLTDDLWLRLEQALNNNTCLQLNRNEELQSGIIQLPSGKMTILELEKLLNILPIDITFVNKNNRVVYVSQNENRIFDRPLTVIGREVKFCHPPHSVHIVEKLLADFKSKEKRSEFFWIHFNNMYVYIQYYAIYDDNDDYIGVVEVTQNISDIQKITGEKRLVE